MRFVLKNNKIYIKLLNLFQLSRIYNQLYLKIVFGPVQNKYFWTYRRTMHKSEPFDKKQHRQ